jgi:iron(II)-dependent oxidoreductase
MPTVASILDRQRALAWYRLNRERSRALFALLDDEAYYSRPISLRHPIVFYEGHLPAFSFNTVVKKGLGGPSIDPALEALFARGIDPDETLDSRARQASDRAAWPPRDVVLQFAEEADRRMLDALANGDVEQAGHPLLDRAEAVFAILEHEAMHQETLLYMWHRLPFEQKRRPAGYAPRVEGRTPVHEWIEIPAGTATLGVDRDSIPFGWDNEFPAFRVDVPRFQLERDDVTNERFLEFVDAGGYDDARWWRPADWEWIKSEGVTHPLFWERPDGRWRWRGMFGLIPLPLAWPVYVSQAEAAAFTRWRDARLPTEAEFMRAAYGDGSAGVAAPTPVVFDFTGWDPEPAGSHPEDASGFGVRDLIGNGWEWTGTPFAPFPGFKASASYPEYSVDFFDGEHFVMKGASPATARQLVRPSFRNWFRARYPYVYATFRCARDHA